MYMYDKYMFIYFWFETGDYTDTKNVYIMCSDKHQGHCNTRKINFVERFVIYLTF